MIVQGLVRALPISDIYIWSDFYYWNNGDYYSIIIRINFKLFLIVLFPKLICKSAKDYINGILVTKSMY